LKNQIEKSKTLKEMHS